MKLKAIKALEVAILAAYRYAKLYTAYSKPHALLGATKGKAAAACLPVGRDPKNLVKGLQKFFLTKVASFV